MNVLTDTEADAFGRELDALRLATFAKLAKTTSTTSAASSASCVTARPAVARSCTSASGR